MSRSARTVKVLGFCAAALLLWIFGNYGASIALAGPTAALMVIEVSIATTPVIRWPALARVGGCAVISTIALPLLAIALASTAPARSGMPILATGFWTAIGAFVAALTRWAPTPTGADIRRQVAAGALALFSLGGLSSAVSLVGSTGQGVASGAQFVQVDCAGRHTSATLVTLVQVRTPGYRVQTATVKDGQATFYLPIYDTWTDLTFYFAPANPPSLTERLRADHGRQFRSTIRTLATLGSIKDPAGGDLSQIELQERDCP